MVSPSLYQEQKNVEETYPYNITAADQAVGIYPSEQCSEESS